MKFPCFEVKEILRDAHGNVYCPGYTYTASNDRLIRMAEAWVMEGKANWKAAGNPVKIGGRGVVV